MRTIDLNADLGETVDAPGPGGPRTVPTADDAAMFAIVSSASIACGGHAGDAESMRDAVATATLHGVAVGAHPSFPDREGFGRRALSLSADELEASVAGQLAALVAAGADVRYVKPHGALYHSAGSDPEIAAAVVRAVRALSDGLGRSLPLLADGAALEREATRVGLPFVWEAFLDRGYLPDGRLVPRTQPQALLHDPDAVAARAVRLVEDGVVEAVDGSLVAVRAASLCVHGDTPAAVAMARAVSDALASAGVQVRAPW